MIHPHDLPLLAPYFETEHVRLFLADCLPAMREMPDRAFDLAIVDPPFGIGAENGTGDYSKAICSNGKKWDIRPPEDYFTELRRVSKNQVIWGGNYFNLPPSRGWACWYKTDEVKGRDFSEFELAYSSFDVPARHFACKPFLRNGIRIHPTQKPVALYRWLLTNYAHPGDTILDTHLGSGSIAIACIDMGFQLTAFEIDEDYLKAAVDRIKSHLRQPKLFKPDCPTMTQESLL
jgi:site-specific DNA-methyltransferase (adenine-specific)